MSSRSALGRDKANTMPGTSRTQQKAEARYNVTTSFPQYDLHFAAASGNLGLVEFALSHGQPINSVLNGVLPIHAACAGGSEIVVKYLIDEGADVNAPRIPRRYSNEKHKSSSLAVGASGSTPLHFAAANGHMGVVRLLLTRGAVPDRADKHGVTPEMLARENGWVECADVLAAWSGGRAGDLPPVQPEELSGSASGPTSGLRSGAGTNGNGTTYATGSGSEGLEKDKERGKNGCEVAELIQNGSKRLHMKRSIDNALHLFRTPLHHHGSQGQLQERERLPPSPSHTHHYLPHLHPTLPSHSHQAHAHSHGGSPSHSHLHSFFHHSHSHSTSQIQSQQPVIPHAQTQSGSGRLTTSKFGGSPSLSIRALGESTSHSASYASPISASPTNQDVFGVPGNRRPSLPQIFDGHASPFKRRLSARKRRPRSAGSEAEEDSLGNSDGVNGGRMGGTSPNGHVGGNGSIPATVNNTSNHANSNTSTIIARKLSSKISLRNIFRRAGGETNSSLSISEGEPGSGSASASTSYSASSAPIYNHTFANAGVGKRGSVSSTPPASPLSTSFTQSLAPMAGAGPGGAVSTGARFRARLGSEGGAGVPRSPLVPSAVELHHQYSQEDLKEEFRLDTEGVRDTNAHSRALAPGLSHRRSILRSHNRSTSSQSSSSTTGAAARTLRFDPSSTNLNTSSSGWPNGISSSIRLRGTKSASSLRHGQSFDHDEDEEEEDYGTSINALESSSSGALRFDDAELDGTTGQDLAPSPGSDGYKYGSVGRVRGASFNSTASSSPGASPANANSAYEHKEFPFSIERPPLTPTSIASESSVTTHYSLPSDSPAENITDEGDEKGGADLRARGESFSSKESEESTTSCKATGSQDSSTSVQTNITTPSPGVHPRTPPVLLANVNDPCEQRSMIAPVSEDKDAVYVHESPSSSLDEIPSPETEQAVVTPLDLRGISNLAEAEALVRRAQQAIIASASLPADGPKSPEVPLSAQLAAYAEIIALERRFARGEQQRELWKVRDDSEGEDEDGKIGLRKPHSAKEARVMQKRRDASIRPRGATTGAPSTGSGFRLKGVTKAPKFRRPHTAEGAPQASWGTNHAATSPSTSITGVDIASAGSGSAPQYAHSHSRSTSSPVYLGKGAEKVPDIEIIETTATPVESPKLPGSPDRRTTDYPSSRYTIDSARPSLPMRSRTPDPEGLASDDDLPFGVPLTRVATAPLQEGNYGSRGSPPRSGSATRRTGGAYKLAKMGFALDAHHHHHHHHNSQAAYSPASSTGSSRSPSKARFGGIKSIVRGLKGKSGA